MKFWKRQKMSPYGARERGFHKKNCFFDIAKILVNPKIIFDVGAWEGDTAEIFLKFFKNSQVYSFEPTPQSFAELIKKFEDDKRVKNFCFALSDKKGKENLYVLSHSPSNSLLKPVKEQLKEQLIEKIEVETTTLDLFCKINGIEKIDLLNMDIQGTEMRLLRGAQTLLKQKRIGLIFTEVLFVDLYEEQGDYFEIARFLSDYGYYLFDFYNFDYDENGQLTWGDAIFLPSLN